MAECGVFDPEPSLGGSAIFVSSVVGADGTWTFNGMGLAVF